MMFSRLCIGIIGGGQLARMSASAAIRLGFDVAILDNDRNAPACQLTHNIYEGWIDNDDVMKAFAERSDIITLENEFIDFHRLEFLENLGRRVVPNPSTIGLIQDKFLQKRLFEKAGIPVSKFSVVQSENDFQQLVKIGRAHV